MEHLEQRDIQRYADGELGRRSRRRIAAHLESCSECSAALGRQNRLGGLLRQLAEDQAALAPLDGLADRVIAELRQARPLPWPTRARVWLDEWLRHRKKVWVPSLTLAGAAAAALLVVLGLGRTTTAPLPEAGLPPGSAVLSVSFGRQVAGTLFQLEDKDGWTTAVIWVDEGQADSEVKRTWHAFTGVASCGGAPSEPGGRAAAARG